MASRYGDAIAAQAVTEVLAEGWASGVGRADRRHLRAAAAHAHDPRRRHRRRPPSPRRARDHRGRLGAPPPRGDPPRLHRQRRATSSRRRWAPSGCSPRRCSSSSDPSVAQRLAGRINSEAFRVNRIIEDLLDLSRIEGEGSPTREPVPVTLFVADAIERIRTAAEQRRHHDRLRRARRQLLVVGDRRQLIQRSPRAAGERRRVLARGGQGQRSRSTRAEPVESDDAESRPARWCASRSPTRGSGIPAKDLERIFERFYRVDPGRARETGGTGLGLSIVRHVAQNHGGNVLVDSREGEGSTFTLELPMRVVTEERVRGPGRRGRGVLHRRAARSGLHREGFDVAVARDGGDALALFDQQHLRRRPARPDAAQGLRARRLPPDPRQLSDVPIIVVSAKGEEIDMVLLLEIGADDYVTKPYRLRELVARIRAVLRRRDGHEQPGRRRRTWSTGPVRLDVESRRCYVDGARSSCARRSSRSCASCSRTPGGCSPARSSSTGCGATTTSGTPRPSTCTSSACAPLIEDDPKAPEHITTVRGRRLPLRARSARRPVGVRPPMNGRQRARQLDGPVGATVRLDDRRPDPRAQPSAEPLTVCTSAVAPSARAVADVGPARLVVAEPADRGDLEPLVDARAVDLEVDGARARGPEVPAAQVEQPVGAAAARAASPRRARGCRRRRPGGSSGWQ